MMPVFILCAGEGTRLRPLTEHRAKPLLPIHGKPLLIHRLESLAAQGFTDIVINAARFYSQIRACLDQYALPPLHITLLNEGEKPLGTGGAVYNAREYLREGSFLLISGDIFGDYPFHTLTLPPNKKALLVCEKTQASQKTDFFLSQDQLFLPPHHGTPVFFASIACIDPIIFEQSWAQPPRGFLELLQQPFEESAVAGILLQQKVYNINTIDDLAVCNSRSWVNS